MGGLISITFSTGGSTSVIDIIFSFPFSSTFISSTFGFPFSTFSFFVLLISFSPFSEFFRFIPLFCIGFSFSLSLF